MEARTSNQILLGRGQAAPRMAALRAGPLSLWLDGADVRRVRLGPIDIAARIYVAVRDPNWGTVPGQVSDCRIESGEGWFRAAFSVSHRAGGIAFGWRGKIRGERDGALTFSMRGQAQSSFLFNVIGICVRHPLNAAGRPSHAMGARGEEAGVLPRFIAPQPVRDGAEVPLVGAFETLEIALDGADARFHFAGGEHEMEDQRNWTDANFKTYSLPPGASGPRQAHVGMPLEQTLTLRANPTRSVEAAPLEEDLEEAPVRVEVGSELGLRMPPLGLGLPCHGEAISAREAGLLRALRPSHLRADAHLGRQDAPQVLARASEACQHLGCALEAALFGSGGDGEWGGRRPGCGSRGWRWRGRSSSARARRSRARRRWSVRARPCGGSLRACPSWAAPTPTSATSTAPLRWPGA